MRFALVAGALVLSASVSDARSVPLTPSKNARTTLVRTEALNIRIGTPIHLSIARRSLIQENATQAPQDILSRPNAAEAKSSPNMPEPPPKKSAPKPEDDGSRVHAYSQPDSRRRSIPITPVSAVAQGSLASTIGDKLPQAFTIKLANAESNQLAAEQPSPVYIIKPISAEVTTTIAEKIKPSAAVVDAVDNIKEGGEPTTALLRAIEHYREEVLQESPAGAVTSTLPSPVSSISNNLSIPQTKRAVETVTRAVSRTAANLSPLQDNTPAIGPIGSTSVSDFDSAGLSAQ
ncbi:hypothetical protein PTTG_07764 [Puccinia triticina 1-1 BBBD Race 1]|uniref:Uncharacterized protein n=2 Tax=Puccinia triticina TaxID=208348 RepID=A0A0C4F3T3_PUCT1|nr:uncharacterized protein PtA15_5A575 [Puccinia triticina]OAV98755.1 hypothetical protein PTTG_07764 [Puccinia triticina 1-1 BBBD Race 1]WAQ85002.1 hypothetical protein PtA15_5A575 [Puccinia triticina]WAR58340.1 hypothetical protein PtB15_5B574 [Puccinia triticina]